MKDAYLTLYDRLLPKRSDVLVENLESYPFSASKAIKALKKKVSWDTLTVHEIDVIIEFSHNSCTIPNLVNLAMFRRGVGILKTTKLLENK